MFPVGSIIKLSIVLAIISIIAGGIYYITGLRANLAISEANNAKLEEGLRDQQQVIDMMQRDMKAIQETNEKLRIENEQQRKDVDALAKKFDKRDLGVFAAAQTEKATILINRGTKNALRCLELASGAPLTEEEKNATSPLEANRECPALIDPSYNSIVN